MTTHARAVTWQGPPALRPLLVPVTKLREDPKNARLHGDRNLDAIEASLREHGQQKNWVCAKDGTMVAGSGGLRVARDRLKWTHVAVTRYPGTAEEARRFALQDNRTADLATWNDEVLAAELQEIQKALGTVETLGWSDHELTRLVDKVANVEVLLEPEAVEGPRKPLTKPGDLWVLDQHRLLCADSTNPDAWRRLMDGKRAHLVCTDPPYGVDYHKTRAGEAHGRIRGDDKKGHAFEEFLAAAFRNLRDHTIRDAAWYVWHSSSTEDAFKAALHAVGVVERQKLIWVKPSPILGRSDYHWQHEPGYYASREGTRPRWFGPPDQSTVWRMGTRLGKALATTVGSGLLLTTGKAELFLQVRAPKGKKPRVLRLDPGQAVEIYADEGASDVWYFERDRQGDHPTTKPIPLAARSIRNSTKPGEVVLDAFLGSGTTLLAAEQLG